MAFKAVVRDDGQLEQNRPNHLRGLVFVVAVVVAYRQSPTIYRDVCKQAFVPPAGCLELNMSMARPKFLECIFLVEMAEQSDLPPCLMTLCLPRDCGVSDVLVCQKTQPAKTKKNEQCARTRDSVKETSNKSLWFHCYCVIAVHHLFRRHHTRARNVVIDGVLACGRWTLRLLGPSTRDFFHSRQYFCIVKIF